MWLGQLALAHFRNYRRLGLDLPPGVLLFRGANGQGKSNLLEAVYVLATTRSPRTSSERELVSWQTPDDALPGLPPFTRLEGRVHRREGEVHLEVLFKGDVPLADAVAAETATAGEVTSPLARSIKVNSLPAKATGLIGQLPVVYFSPEDVQLAGGTPSNRRQYLNVANSQAAPLYLRALQQYNRILSQRNQALRQVRERRQPRAAVEPWTEQLVRAGSAILRQRQLMLHGINSRAAELFADLSGLPGQLRVVYRSSVLDGGELPHDIGSQGELAHLYRQRLEQLAAREVEQAVTLVGPHRDDFAFVLGEVDLNTYGSRGQQRLAVLALKLAEAEWMCAEIGEVPVLLLDDLLSELDPRRRGYVLDRVARLGSTSVADGPAHQLWLTATDLDDFPPELLAAARRFDIDAGTVRAA